MMNVGYDNLHCKIAAQMLHTQPGLLDYRLIEYLNNVADLTNSTGGELKSRQVIALAIVSWREGPDKTVYGGLQK